MSYSDGIEHPSKNNNHSRRNGVNTQMNEIERMKKQKPFIFMDEEHPHGVEISLRFEVCEGFDRVLTTFADEKRTKERLKKDVFFGDDGRYHIKEGTALYKLASILLENHLDSHDDEGNYVNDMETKINIRKSLTWGIKADEFYLDDSITFIDSHLPPFLVWSVINEQGQQIVFLEHKKHPLQWSLDGNIVDDNGNSDYFSEKYDGESLYYDPINTIYPTNL